ncbi:MAG: lactate utilization protein [SAR324 cluster bacterium]|nr:lactate utilization protein [SAR324 cluster bacterium]
MDFDFAKSFEKLSGVAHKVDSEKAAAEKIAIICQEQDAKCIALAGLSASLISQIEASCSNLMILKEPYRAEELPGAIDKADLGITGIAFAMAQSGTMVEVTTNDANRLVSSLPRTHIGVLQAADIVDKYHDGSQRMREVTAQHDSNLVITFISGPSRTGDIELILSLGVHGPASCHAVIIDK